MNLAIHVAVRKDIRAFYISICAHDIGAVWRVVIVSLGVSVTYLTFGRVRSAILKDLFEVPAPR